MLDDDTDQGAALGNQAAHEPPTGRPLTPRERATIPGAGNGGKPGKASREAARRERMAAEGKPVQLYRADGELTREGRRRAYRAAKLLAEVEANKLGLTAGEHAQLSEAELAARVEAVSDGVRREDVEKLAGPLMPRSSGQGLPPREEREQQKRAEIEAVKGLGILPRGRPSQFTEEEADAVCTWVAGGHSLRSYCEKSGRSMYALQCWMRERPAFEARYRQACEDRAMVHAEDTIAIADEAAINPTIEGVAAAKLRVEARRWFASKMHASVFGDKQTVQHQGAVSIRMGIGSKPQDAEVVDVEARTAPTALPEPSEPAASPMNTPFLDGLNIRQAR
jgi:hypothetical protein